ncbi:MAG: T9SS type A sorting domain-containing protein [Paludibacteraceae bacterium]|nr:T9SS type A sorting domain-containing protein [Paludibacteraceae bacterium]
MKRFYNNTLMSGAFSKALRVVALLCVLLGVSTSAWAKKYYIDASCIDGVYKVNWLQDKDSKSILNNASLSQTDIYSFETSYNPYKIEIQYQQSSWENRKIEGLNIGSHNCFVFKVENGNLTYTVKTYNAGDALTCSSSGGGAAACTPSTTITEAVYDASTGKVTLKGNFTTCGTKWHGFQWRKVGSDWCPQNDPKDYSGYISSNTDKDGEETAEFTATKGVNYEFRTYIVTDPEPWIYSTTPTYVSTTSSSSGCITVYLKTNENWRADNARFAAYFWKSSNTNINEWIDMKFANECGEGIYYCTVPDGKDKVIFCRMNPGTTANNWDNKWNQSGDLTVPTDDNTQWTFPETIYDGYTGSWSASECDQTDCQEITPDIPDVTYNSEVLLTYDPVYNEETKEAKVYAYFKINPGVDECTNISQYGFAYCQGYGCRPEELVNGNHIVVGTSDLSRGEEFNATLTGLLDNAVYGYRGYIANGDNIIFSDETRYFSTGGCIPIPGGGDTIRVTVDGLKYPSNHADECKLIFGNFQTAIDALKKNTEYCVNGNLRQPVVISVAQKDENGSYSGKDQTVSGGNNGASQTLTVNVISGFNKGGIGYDEKNVLIVRANNGDKPRLEHLLIRSSRNIIIEGINIISNPADNGKTKDTALEIDDGNSSNWEGGTCTLPNANITVRNCMIGSNGFTGMHVNGVGNLVFENNVFNLSYSLEGIEDADAKNNIIGWGASVKFLECKDIKFVRNNLWGAHNTTLWLQQIENALFYNNVLWNNNTIAGNTRAIRIYKQYNGNNQITPNHIAFLYNTFYVKDGSTTKDQTFDFISSECAKSDQCHDIGSVTFLYNNCYSYDPDLGKKSGSWQSKFNGTNHFCPNNFWSKYDFDNNNKTSVFELESCDDAEFINVSNYLCETSIAGPASLVVKQPEDAADAGLKTALPVSLDQVKGYCNLQNITEADIKADRYRNDIRKGNKWTYGAYEATSSNAVNTIYWVGGYSSDWDYRANWSWINSDGVAQQLSCVDNLNENLKIVIPRRYSNSGYPVSTTGKYFYPKIPDNFSSDARQSATIDEEKDLPSGIPASEQVSAGRGYVEPTRYAKDIELEYGAAITGVEYLAKEGEDIRYEHAAVGFEAPRDQWILVGTVIKPKDEEKPGEYRNIISGDYFVPGQLPHVYMHQVSIEDNVAKWDETFSSLKVEVPVTSIFAIRIPDEYGPYKLPAEFYNSWYGGNYDPKESIKYDNFVGKFVNESSLPSYTVKPGPNMLNNSYPCCIDPDKIPEEVGTVLCYDYAANSFKSPKGFERKEVLINPQHGFIFIPATGVDKFEVTNDMFVGADTRSRSAESELPTLSLNLYNANTLIDNSNVVLRIDEMLGDEESIANTPKVFATNAGTPELYIISNDKMYTTFDASSSSQLIPLGVRLKKDMNIMFKKIYSNDIDKAILVDTYTDKEYNLLERSYTTEVLVSGDIEGRFYLNLGISENNEDNDDTTDDNVSTEVEENSAEKAINIFVDEDNNIRVITNGVELKNIYVSDMTGRMMSYSVKGYAASLNLPVAKGTYLVHVIAENVTRSEKVILN